MRIIEQRLDPFGEIAAMNLLSPYVYGLAEPVGSFFYNFWTDPDGAEQLIALERESGIRMLPRYIWDNALIDSVEELCWMFRQEMEFLESGDDVVFIAKDPACNLEKTSTFHEVLISDPSPSTSLLAPIPLNNKLGEELVMEDSDVDSLRKALWKKNAPFLGVKKDEHFHDAVPNLEIEGINHDDVFEELAENSNKEYAKKYLAGAADDFIDSYLNDGLWNVRRACWSYSSLWKIKQRYVEGYHHAIKEGLRKEAAYAFYQIGNKYKIRFNNKELSEKKLSGFKYIYFLVCNQNEEFTHQQLDLLNGLASVADNYEFLEAIQGIDGTESYDFIDETASRFYQKELEILKNKLSDAIEEGDFDRQKILREQLEEHIYYFEESHHGNGKVKKVRGEYRKVQNKIGKAIKDTIKWMAKEDYLDVAVHFRKSINHYANRISYRSIDTNIKWHI
ncbi:hypothetical protein [Desulfogranum marinum]|uniref:hypothetical protein n=1 Tax=Desulfogranum marinum TaxID=453220 RepID=UPI00196360D0|nr:hypothetical protein [Desulfogranum marinum]MBM9512008.1 hypothetical protein [Desulfogranum marinum]